MSERPPPRTGGPHKQSRCGILQTSQPCNRVGAGVLQEPHSEARPVEFVPDCRVQERARAVLGWVEVGLVDFALGV